MDIFVNWFGLFDIAGYKNYTCIVCKKNICTVVKEDRNALQRLFLKLIQIYFIFSDTAYIVYLFFKVIQSPFDTILTVNYYIMNHIGAIDCRFEPRSNQTKDYKIGICCFSAKRSALRKKSKDWLAWNQDNVFKWGDMSTRRLLFQWASTIKIKLSVLV